MATPENSATPIVIYQAADGSIATEVRLEAAIRNFQIARQEGQRPVERTLRKLCKRPITVIPANWNGLLPLKKGGWEGFMYTGWHTACIMKRSTRWRS